jgi:hypothetical protein
MTVHERINARVRDRRCQRCWQEPLRYISGWLYCVACGCVTSAPVSAQRWLNPPPWSPRV